jgi:hypothetical protein
MPRKKKSEEPLDTPELNGVHEEIPTIPSPTRASHMRVVKEFDLRAAHLAWKERNGIEDGW